MSPRATVVFAAALFALAAHARTARADDADRCASRAEAGQQARLAGKLRAAREELIECASEACPQVVRRDCARWLSEVETELPTIVVRARDGRGQDLADVRVFVDDVLLASRLEGKAVAVDAGEHTFRFERAGAPPVSRRVIVHTGERARIVTVDLDGGDVEPARRASPVGPFVLGGIGAAAAATGIVLWAVGKSEHDDLASSCAPDGLCATSDVDAARTKLMIGDVAVLAGALALTGAVAWWLLAQPARSSVRALAPGVVRF